MAIPNKAVEAARKAFNDCRITDIDSLNNLFRTILEAAEPFITAANTRVIADDELLDMNQALREDNETLRAKLVAKPDIIDSDYEYDTRDRGYIHAVD